MGFTANLLDFCATRESRARDLSDAGVPQGEIELSLNSLHTARPGSVEYRVAAHELAMLDQPATSAREPTATMRPPDTASASAVGCVSSTVRMVP